MRALSVPQGARKPLRKELGLFMTGTRRTVYDKLEALGGLVPFFACNASNWYSEDREKAYYGWWHT